MPPHFHCQGVTPTEQSNLAFHLGPQTVGVLGWILVGQEEAGAGKGVHNELGDPDAASGEEAWSDRQSHLPLY